MLDFDNLVNVMGDLDEDAMIEILEGVMEDGGSEAEKAMEACRRFTPAFYKKTAELVLETDRKFKTSVDSAQRLLEMLILQLAQEAKHG